jgi:hypothetical protein
MSIIPGLVWKFGINLSPLIQKIKKNIEKKNARFLRITKLNMSILLTGSGGFV